MRKLLILIAALLAAGASAQTEREETEVVTNSSGYKLLRTRGHNWLWGFGATTPPSTFNSENIPQGAAWLNTSTGVVSVYTASGWTSQTVANVTPGTTTLGSSTDCFAFADASSILRCDNTVAKLDNSGAGNGVFTVGKTMSGGSAVSNFLNITGTFPTTMTGAAVGIQVPITTAGSSSQLVTGLRVSMGPGYTGSSATLAVFGNNAVAGTGANLFTAVSNAGVYGASTATTSGYNIGTQGVAGGGAISVGVLGRATQNKDSATTVGVAGIGGNGGATPTARVGGYFGLDAATPTFLESALSANNAAIAAPIIVAQDNGAALPTTGATATWQVADGAWEKVGNGILTNATMAAETQGRASGGLVHSYTWTNAQVVALGASLTGDITVATLPAKTQVRNAYVVITGQAAGPATVTVSCGDAIGGTPFINYIVPSDAKAAANTVYGDAAGERGTSMDVEFYNLPSYTATTLVTCHFISTVANLDQVTGSTGRVILETVTLP